MEPDVFKYDQTKGKPVFDLIIGCNLMEKLGIELRMSDVAVANFGA